ncbi:hypothetical protein PPYR_15635 [Photinus pyralis]|uniref:Uncharacterized protein n=1 Tax=Photinus pyralis TaxID=7054 RepID=A0A1Y1M6S2_PHOPY|nr:uncharacterized protein LOC116169394 [Photinus pyralis]XP_031359207.1 uncharacterized protein LOC116182807 [Photinus pyralis]KAB0790043.1 hypothetical protein PPYR_15635 [Photinus pyralis]
MYLVLIGTVLLITHTTVYGLPLNEKERACAEKHNLSTKNIEMWNIEPLIPEDNVEMLEYMSCYWKNLGYLTEDGEIDFVKLGDVVHADLNARFHAEFGHIVAFIMDNCKQTVHGETDGLRAVKMWNCLNVYTENLF